MGRKDDHRNDDDQPREGGQVKMTASGSGGERSMTVEGGRVVERGGHGSGEGIVQSAGDQVITD